MDFLNAGGGNFGLRSALGFKRGVRASMLLHPVTEPYQGLISVSESKQILSVGFSMPLAVHYRIRTVTPVAISGLRGDPA